jgi:hypothetical protein
LLSAKAAEEAAQLLQVKVTCPGVETNTGPLARRNRVCRRSALTQPHLQTSSSPSSGLDLARYFINSYHLVMAKVSSTSFAQQFDGYVGTITLPSEKHKVEALETHATEWRFDDIFNGVTVLFSPPEPDIE